MIKSENAREKAKERCREYHAIHKEEDKQYAKQYYEANKDIAKQQQKDKAKRYYQKHISEIKETARNKRAWIDSVKTHYGCQNTTCKWVGTYYPSMLEFHHINPKTKAFEVNNVNRSLSAIANEMNKCVVLCSNCHRLETAGELVSTFAPCNLNNEGIPNE